MHLQIIQDSNGQDTGVFVPINEWKVIIQKYKDLQEIVEQPKTKKIKLSSLYGAISKGTSDKLSKNIEDSRNEWEIRVKEQE